MFYNANINHIIIIAQNINVLINKIVIKVHMDIIRNHSIQMNV